MPSLMQLARWPWQAATHSLDLAAALAGLVDPGDGDVARAIRAVQRKHFDPPELDERVQPHRRMAPAR
jgi:hypothetical protein